MHDYSGAGIGDLDSEEFYEQCGRIVAMLQSFAKLIIIGMLCCIMLTNAACQNGYQTKVGLCAASAAVTLVLVVISEEVAEIPTAVVTGITVSECTDALNAVIGSDPANPQTIIIAGQGKPKKVPLVFSTTLPVINCGSATPINQENITVQAGIKVLLEIGDQTFSSRPSAADTSELSMLARGLIDQYHIPVGTNLTTPVTATVSLPAHSQTSIKLPPISVTLATGMAEFTQNGTPTSSPTSQGIGWNYPEKIQTEGAPSVGAPMLCE